MSLTVYVLFGTALVVIELIYLRIARRFRLFDQPNHRSAHTKRTIVRGGGIVFYVAGLGAVLIGKPANPFFLTGLTFVALISFWDDVSALPWRYRLGVQLVAVYLLIMPVEYAYNHWWLVAGLTVIGAGILNSYNFMDGINGMTAFYSLATVGTLWCNQVQQGSSVNEALLPSVFLSVLVFSYFNARRQAVCFAGDVGSISIAFIILYCLLSMMILQKTYLFVLFLAVYGIDTGLTMLHRLYRGQAIFQAHQLHLFQLLVHRLRWPHLRVSALYALVQLGINGLVLQVVTWSAMAQVVVACLLISGLTVVYVVARRRLMNPDQLIESG